MARILVTGTTGFIGRHLVPALCARGHEVVEAGRRPRKGASRFVAVGEIGPETDWRKALEGVDAVVHLAGIAQRNADSNGDHDRCHRVNALGTEQLAQQACDSESRTLVFLSSIFAGREDPSAYARSKRAAEVHVAAFSEGGRAGIVLRPPLVYGSDAGGNWKKLQRLAASGLPLPFGAIANRRSLCSVGNLCSAVAVAVEAGLKGAGSGTYEIADREAVSLAQMLGWLRDGMEKPRRLIPLPASFLRIAGRASGRRELFAALLDDLVADPSGFMRVFAWSPSETAEEAIKGSGRLYAARLRNGVSAVS